MMETFDRTYERVFVDGFYDYHGADQGCLTREGFLHYSDDYVIRQAWNEAQASGEAPSQGLVNDLARRYIQPSGGGSCTSRPEGGESSGGGTYDPGGGTYDQGEVPDTPRPDGGTPGDGIVVPLPSGKISRGTSWGTILLVGGVMAATWYYLKGRK